jgi:prepilin-type N-terminal cleavage/methylation domain-containing protein/prepilin-type processing-associated H-X9-DG protein
MSFMAAVGVLPAPRVSFPVFSSGIILRFSALAVFADTRPQSVFFFLHSLEGVVMVHCHLRKRHGFTLIELLVVITIMGILAGMLMNGVMQANVTARRMACCNNLRNIGFAMQNFAATNSVLPTENPNPDDGAPQSFYFQLLGNLESEAAASAFTNNGVTTPIGVFLDPTRRGTQNAPGKRDFGYGGAWGTSALSYKGGASLSTIGSVSGTATTALLTEVWLDPATYQTDTVKWSDAPGAGNSPHNTSKPTATRDTDPSGSGGLGSPHPGGMPVLFCDNHAQTLSYTRFAQWDKVWDVTNSTVPIRLP